MPYSARAALKSSIVKVVLDLSCAEKNQEIIQLALRREVTLDDCPIGARPRLLVAALVLIRAC